MIIGSPRRLLLASGSSTSVHVCCCFCKLPVVSQDSPFLLLSALRYLIVGARGGIGCSGNGKKVDGVGPALLGCFEYATRAVITKCFGPPSPFFFLSFRFFLPFFCLFLVYKGQHYTYLKMYANTKRGQITTTAGEDTREPWVTWKCGQTTTVLEGRRMKEE